MNKTGPISVIILEKGSLEIEMGNMKILVKIKILKLDKMFVNSKKTSGCGSQRGFI